MKNLIDISSDPIANVLDVLLQDKSTKKNIIWATDTYEDLGEEFADKAQITVSTLLRQNNLICPRIQKALEAQSQRTRRKAEVFTPAWLCNRMNNHCDEDWFGQCEVFNIDNEDHTWTVTESKIEFPKNKTWQQYVDSRRLEIACGEAPYLVSRYDVSTGELIVPPIRRIGILDRKLRIVNENTEAYEEWLKWTIRAFEASYGYEYQGDSVLIARINLLLTFTDYYEERWKQQPDGKLLRQMSNKIAWNVWQMDGLNHTVPLGKPYEKYRQLTFFDLFDDESDKSENESEAVPCRIYDWRNKTYFRFIDLKEMSAMGKKLFDYVIGNPPYQDDYVGSNNQTKPVYNLFMDNAFEISEVVELITPARFLTHAGATPKDWNRKMLTDPHFKILHYEEDSSKAFSDVDIKGGVVVSYFSWNETFEPIEIFIKSAQLRSVFEKIKGHLKENVGELVHSPDSFRFTDVLFEENPNLIGRTDQQHAKAVASNVFERYPEIFHVDRKKNDVKVIGRKANERVTFFAKNAYFNDQGNLHKWKVLVAGAIGSGTFGETLSDPIIAEPNSAHTQTFLSMGEFDTKYQAEALAKYLKTKFARALLGIMKTTQNNQAKITWSKIPLQDFTPNSDIDWSKSIHEIDLQLYRKYGLDEQEIDFIESRVKEMA
ncbi:MAG: Eco57I restriction-modification methylase domain-containing protein [Saccharofermentanales bacterium]